MDRPWRRRPALLAHPTELELIKQLLRFPELVGRAAEARAPHMICEYLESTAGRSTRGTTPATRAEPGAAVWSAFPSRCGTPGSVLARAIQIVLRNGLELLGLGAPERMEREESE
jgi:arginyl-tRNA synthetase